MTKKGKKNLGLALVATALVISIASSSVEAITSTVLAAFGAGLFVNQLK